MNEKALIPEGIRAFAYIGHVSVAINWNLQLVSAAQKRSDSNRNQTFDHINNLTYSQPCAAPVQGERPYETG